ncbi:hypothetical protein HELRODRAFT_89777 [Helobdella robusta]|uniref:Uncharacterized protein n=1 Tax=Helobdella robusta TaxID=6412 RepID=T1G7H5_HELRO|nr:hypothetical protein HELRODRAFT_89777 [Helobdella robusta]ESN92199.1 hypothetical protein HELRODRAFT_89777 [Helobdella robusta]
MPLFGGKHKTPHELVKSLNENLSTKSLADSKDEASLKKYAKVQEEISKCLSSMKSILASTSDQESHGGSSETVNQLAQEVHNAKLLHLMVENLGKIDFEGRKDVVSIFISLLRRQAAGSQRHPTVDHICENRDVLDLLMVNYKNQELALNCGVILRECFRYEELVKLVLNSDNFYKFFEYVEVTTFDISSDAFLTFKELLTKHRAMMAQFLEENYETFFKSYHSLISSDNYVTRRQALKLLGELLLERNNFSIMTRYISNPDNLLMIMNMLKESSKNIQFEAFHVFKVFVANPDKPPSVQEILLRRRDKLLEYLSKFHSERSDDEQFNDEKAYLIKQIKELKPLEDTAAVSTAGGPQHQVRK